MTPANSLPTCDRISEAIHLYWPALSDSEVNWVQQSRDRLLFLIVRTYGYSRDEAQRQVALFFHRAKLTMN